MSLILVTYDAQRICIATDKRAVYEHDMSIASDNMTKIHVVREGLYFYGGSHVQIGERYTEIVKENSQLPTKDLIKLVRSFEGKYYNENLQKEEHLLPFICGEHNGVIFFCGGKDMKLEYIHKGDTSSRTYHVTYDDAAGDELASFLNFLTRSTKASLQVIIETFMLYGAYLTPKVVGADVDFFHHELNKKQNGKP